MSIKYLITVAMIFSTGVILPACVTPDAAVGIPATDLKVIVGPCGPEFHGEAHGSTDIAIGGTGFRWEQTTNTRNRIYKPCKAIDDTDAE